MRASYIAILAMLGATPAYALITPPADGPDPHMRTVKYNSLDRTNLVGELGRETTITFAPDEHIARVVFGDSDYWIGPTQKEIEGTPLGNNLPLWPLVVTPTNLQVTTLAGDGSQKVYQFQLSAREAFSGGDDNPEAVFGLKFIYPEVVKQADIDAWRARKAAADKKVASDRLVTDVFYGDRNWKYIARPNQEWISNGWPKPEVSDNGQLTAFLFQGNVPEPAIYLVDKSECGPGGAERLAPFSDQHGLKVISQTAQHFRLRLGDSVMEVCNEGFDPIGQNPGTGTTSPGVVREVRAAR